MTTYAITMATAEQAEFLADKQGNSMHLKADGATVEFGEAAHDWFSGRPETDDGHLADGVLYFGGNAYPVRPL